MIERKRRNDFVRKREFDMLRKMRRSEVLAGQDPGLRPSFFQSSMPSKPDDRATDAEEDRRDRGADVHAVVEDQAWRQSQQPGGNSAYPVSSHVPPDAMRAATTPPGARVHRARRRRNSRAARAPRSAAVGHGFHRSPACDHAGTGPGAAAIEVGAAGWRPAGHARGAAAGHAACHARIQQPDAREIAAAGAVTLPGDSNSFSQSKQFAIQVEEFAHDPELEEASIRFANGDNEGAEAGLMEVLGPQGTRVNHDETWLTLFDLYRATGNQDQFESAAIDFAGRFGRSAPQWFSMPEIVGRMSQPAAATAPGQPLADWTCPSVFGTQTAAALNAALAKATQPYKLNWTKLNSIAEGAVEP